MPTHGGGDWNGYIDASYPFAGFPAGARVLDVGFGAGRQMRALVANGCVAFGIEYDERLAARGGAAGLRVCRAKAEQLPFRTATLDGVVCKVVVPYTDEAVAIAEIARVLRPGGTARMSYHGLGYSLKYLFTERNWKRRVYAARVIANTSVYVLTGARLAGFLGDALYQSSARLRTYYGRSGLNLVEERLSARYAGAPVFLYHTVRRQST